MFVYSSSQVQRAVQRAQPAAVPQDFFKGFLSFYFTLEKKRPAAVLQDAEREGIVRELIASPLLPRLLQVGLLAHAVLPASKNTLNPQTKPLQFKPSNQTPSI
jgi:hypothetical protein